MYPLTSTFILLVLFAALMLATQYATTQLRLTGDYGNSHVALRGIDIICVGALSFVSWWFSFFLISAMPIAVILIGLTAFGSLYGLWRSVKEEHQIKIINTGTLFVLAIFLIFGWYVGLTIYVIPTYIYIILGSFVATAIFICFQARIGFNRENNKSKRIYQAAKFLKESFLQIIIISTLSPFVIGLIKLVAMIYKGAPLEYYWQGT